VDPEALRSALNNILQNAFKYTPAGGQVQLEAKATSAGELEVLISDTGPGIPEDELPLIFDRFFRGSSAAEGTGIGLAIAKDIVKAHSGSISATSTPGKGSVFCVKIPGMGGDDR